MAYGTINNNVTMRPDAPDIPANLPRGVRKVLAVALAKKPEDRWCPPGSFTMGSPKSDVGRENSEKQHKVTLTKGFWLVETPVTQEQWMSVTGSNPSYFGPSFIAGLIKRGDMAAEYERRPVENVSWDDCQLFIQKVNAQLGVEARLPTEAEWEYACRAGTTTAYYWGNALNGDKANFDGNHPCGTTMKCPYRKQTTPVGSYSANAWGFYDMHGNVWECVKTGMVIIRRIALLIRKVLHRATSVSCAAAAGATSRGTAVPPAATGPTPATATTTSVSASVAP